MRCVISYKYSGADKKRLNQLLSSVANALEELGQEYFCLEFVREEVIAEAGEYSEHIMLKRALAEIDTCDYLLVVYDQQEKSAGMLMEIGYAIAKNKPVYMLINNNVAPGYVQDMADAIASYNCVEDIKSSVDRLTTPLAAKAKQPA